MKSLFCRSVPVSYWHAEAIVTKRVKNFTDTRAAYFDGPTKDAAARGLRQIIMSQSYRPKFFKAISEHTVYIFIPFWSRACWSEKHRHRYMRKKGFFHADCQ